MFEGMWEHQNPQLRLDSCAISDPKMSDMMYEYVGEHGRMGFQPNKTVISYKKWGKQWFPAFSLFQCNTIQYPIVMGKNIARKRGIRSRREQD